MDLKEEIAKNRQELNRVVETIRDNPKLSDEGKAEAIGQVYDQAYVRHEALLAQHNLAIEEQREKLHGELFKPSFTIGQPDYERDRVRAEYRRALGEADAILHPDPDATEYDVQGLLRFLERAELAGDALAHRAAFTIASNKGATSVVQKYLENRPEVAQTYERHQALEQETREPSAIQKIAQSFELSPPTRPREIQNNTGTNTMSEIFSGGS